MPCITGSVAAAVVGQGCGQEMSTGAPTPTIHAWLRIRTPTGTSHAPSRAGYLPTHPPPCRSRNTHIAEVGTQLGSVPLCWLLADKLLRRQLGALIHVQRAHHQLRRLAALRH